MQAPFNAPGPAAGRRHGGAPLLAQFALAQAAQALDERGKLKDPKLQERLEVMVTGYLLMGTKLSSS